MAERVRKRVKRQIVPALEKITETELMKSLASPTCKDSHPKLHRMVKEEGGEYLEQLELLKTNVRDALEHVGKHHKSKWNKLLGKGLLQTFKIKHLGMTHSEGYASNRKLTETEADYFQEQYAKGVVRQRIQDLEVAGWMDVAERCLEQKSGDTDQVVYYIRGDRMRWFWEKLAPRAWEVYKWCWEQEPQFNYRPPKTRKETTFERNMRVWVERGAHGRDIPPVTMPVEIETIDLDGDLETEPGTQLLNYVGYNTILCRSAACVWQMLKRDRGKQTGCVYFEF